MQQPGQPEQLERFGQLEPVWRQRQPVLAGQQQLPEQLVGIWLVEQPGLQQHTGHSGQL